MTKNEIFNYLKNLAKEHDVIIREYSAISGFYLIQWKRYFIGKDKKIGTVCISINPLENANEIILESRFRTALSTLEKNEPQAV